MYPALFVLPTDPLPTALKLMRQERFPLAIVRDASGQVLGILTLDDVIQQVIGEIIRARLSRPQADAADVAGLDPGRAEAQGPRGRRSSVTW